MNLASHADNAARLKGYAEEYAGQVRDCLVLESYLGSQHEAVVGALAVADDRFLRARTALVSFFMRGGGKLEGADVLALSPAFGGPATRTYRIVLLRLDCGALTVHRWYCDTIGGCDEGSYFKADQYGAALMRWLERVTRETNRPAACHLADPV